MWAIFPSLLWILVILVICSLFCISLGNNHRQCGFARHRLSFYISSGNDRESGFFDLGFLPRTGVKSRYNNELAFCISFGTTWDRHLSACKLGMHLLTTLLLKFRTKNLYSPVGQLVTLWKLATGYVNWSPSHKSSESLGQLEYFLKSLYISFFFFWYGEIKFYSFKCTFVKKLPFASADDWTEYPKIQNHSSSKISKHLWL